MQWIGPEGMIYEDIWLGGAKFGKIAIFILGYKTVVHFDLINLQMELTIKYASFLVSI